MANYKTYLKKKNAPVSIAVPIPGKEIEMKQNLAGGYAFKIDDFKALRRWLLTGSMKGAFYQDAKGLTEDNVKVLEGCVNTNPSKVADEILYASNNGISNSTPILALVYLSKSTNEIGKKVFRSIFNQVIRTASHLYEFVLYVRELRGFGKTIHKAIKGWLDAKDAKELEYQFLKYQQRDGWAGKDVLRMVKPKTKDALKNAVYAWVVGKNKGELNEELKRLRVYEALKTGGVSEGKVVEAINAFSLTHEMIPANIERTKKVWEALFSKMPVTALVRNLGNLTSKGIFDKVANLDILESKFSKENLAHARMHPLTLASAYKVYSMGGMIGKSSLRWTPINRVLDILDKAVENAFDALPSSRKKFIHALDLSGSMNGVQVANLWIDAIEVESIMALATIRSSVNYEVFGFDTRIRSLDGMNKRTSFMDVLKRRHVDGFGGGTNCSLPLEHALQNKIHADVIVCYTDNESWVGKHIPEMLKEYRKTVNKDVKVIFITLVAYGDKISLVDPNDSNCYDIAGFSSETVKLIQLIADGDI
jgi:60 kDa SS-A/Ro ribonucleoprotein